MLASIPPQNQLRIVCARVRACFCASGVLCLLCYSLLFWLLLSVCLYVCLSVSMRPMSPSMPVGVRRMSFGHLTRYPFQGCTHKEGWQRGHDYLKKLMWLSLYVPDMINTIIASHAMPAINAHCHGAISASFRHRRKQNKGKKVCCIGKCYCQLYWK